MNINVNLDDVKDGPAVQTELDADLETCSGPAWTVVFLCHRVGISRLDDKTMPDFLRRLKLWEQYKGLLWRTGVADGHRLVEFPREHVERMKGLRTNVTPLGIRKFRELLEKTA